MKPVTINGEQVFIIVSYTKEQLTNIFNQKAGDHVLNDESLEYFADIIADHYNQEDDEFDHILDELIHERLGEIDYNDEIDNNEIDGLSA